MLKHKFKILLLLLIVAGGSLFAWKKYEARQYYLWATTTFELDTSPIYEVHNQTFDYLLPVESILVLELEGNNMLGEPVYFEVDYFYDDSALDGQILFELMPVEVVNALGRSSIPLTYSVVGYEAEGELAVTSRIDNVDFDPIFIDTSKDLDYYTEDSITVYSSVCDFEFDVPMFSRLIPIIEDVYEGTPSATMRMLNSRIAVINTYYDVPEDFDYFSVVYGGGLDDISPFYLESLESAFNELPIEIKQHMFFNRAVIKGSDYSFIDQEYVDRQNRQYSSDYTLSSYPNRVAGTYNHSVLTILLNNNKSVLHYRYLVDFREEYWEWDLTDAYSIHRHNGRRTNPIRNLSSLKARFEYEFINTFYHELGHYIDFNSRYGYRLTPTKMASYRGLYPYRYELDYDYEHIAYAFSVYFEDSDYLEREVPEMYELLENILNGLDMRVVDDYYGLLDYYSD